VRGLLFASDAHQPLRSGAFIFARESIKRMLASQKDGETSTLIFTGATAALRCGHLSRELIVLSRRQGRCQFCSFLAQQVRPPSFVTKVSSLASCSPTS
jgi:hypothetical protein